MTLGNVVRGKGQLRQGGEEAHKRCIIDQKITVSNPALTALRWSGRRCKTWPWVAPSEEKETDIFILQLPYANGWGLLLGILTRQDASPGQCRGRDKSLSRESQVLTFECLGHGVGQRVHSGVARASAASAPWGRHQVQSKDRKPHRNLNRKYLI